MKCNRFFHLLAAAIFIMLILFATFAPQELRATERVVVMNTSECPTGTTPPPCYTSISTAIAAAQAANAGDSIKIMPGTYPANVTISRTNITLYGVETARTFLTGNGGTTITVDGVNTLMSISKLTFLNASPAIKVMNASSQVSITNNVFEVGGTNTAIQVLDTSTPSILNNTFYQNGTAISSNQNNLTVANNIFFNNALAISTNVALANIQNNLFNPTSTAGPPGIVFDSTDPNNKRNISGDPLFVPSAGDFHLQSLTPCKNAGTTSYGIGANSIDSGNPPDIGAYGASGSDTVPFPVSGLSGTNPSGNTINLSWSLNACYMIGGYNIYFSADKSGSPYDNGPVNAGIPNPFPYALDVTNYLPPQPALTPPTGLTSQPSSGTLTVSWQPVAGATGYEVSYKKTTDSTFTVLPLINTTTVTLSGLTNPINGVPTMYDISIRSYYQTIFYVAVTDYYTFTSPPNPKEALAFSNEAQVPIGNPVFGTTPSTIQDFPEPVTPNPNLPNTGCFIATAAYGYYSAPQVQALREFRDQYLLTNAPGRAFVQWYYRNGPVAARYISEHPEYKPIVRAALMPAVAGAMFMTGTSMLTKTIVFVMIGLFVMLQLRRKHPFRFIRDEK